MNETLYGMQLIAAPMLPEFDYKRVKTHQRKHWMGRRCYHRRIQKKWDKRFGLKKTLHIVSDGRAIYAHPSTIRRIKQSLATI